MNKPINTNLWLKLGLGAIGFLFLGSLIPSTPAPQNEAVESQPVPKVNTEQGVKGTQEETKKEKVMEEPPPETKTQINNTQESVEQPVAPVQEPAIVTPTPTVTPEPEPEPPIASNCDPNYSGACVPIASDVDCAGGSGNGPAYVVGPVYIKGIDIYGLDRDKNGVGCE